MGANTFDRQNYWSIVSGRLWTKLSKDHPDAVRREYTDKQGETHEMWGKWCDSWTGLITDVLKRENTFGIQLIVTMRDENEDCAIVTPFDSRYSVDLMKRLTSPDFSILDQCELRPFSMEDPQTEKTKHYFLVTQNGNKIKSPWSEENPLPDWEKITVRGKEVWDNTLQLNFLYNKMRELFGGTGIEVENNDPPDLGEDTPF